MTDKNTVVVSSPEELGSVATRRSFLRMLGVGGSIVLLPSVFAACGDDDAGPYGLPGTGGSTGAGGAVVLNLSTDTGILNYAYALEQLEAAFYTQVVGLSNFATLFNAVEQEVLTDLYRHEVIHRELFRAALGTARIPDLAVNFGTTISAPTKAGIGTATVTFEDVGVSAYNGAGQFLDSAAFLTLAGKIVSVEARHAAVARTLFLTTPNTAFADLANIQTADNTNALDAVRLPDAVLPLVDPVITTNVSIGTPAS